MARDSSGNYSLPAGNPVVPGTTIETSWGNNTMNDIATALTNSLDRTGSGGMTASLKLTDGTATAPGLAFNSETNTGLHRSATGTMNLTVLGSDIATFTSAATTILNTATFSDIDINGGEIDGTPIGGTTRAAGAFTAVGIGTSSPAEALDVDGSTILRPDTGAALTITNAFNAGVSEITNLAGATYISTDTDGELGTAAFTAFRVSNLDVKMVVRGDGNVGIGQAAPNRLLHLTGDDATIKIEDSDGTGNGARIQFFTGTTAQGTIRSGGTLGNAMAFYANGGANERMRVDAAGRLLVGTDTGSNQLTVESGAGDIALLKSTVAGGYVTFEDSTTATAPQVGAVGDLLALRTNSTNRAFLGTRLDLRCGLREELVTLTGTSIALDTEDGNLQKLTVTGNTTFTDSMTGGDYMTLILASVGSDTITWPTIKWAGGSAPTLDATADNIIVLTKFGSDLYASYTGAFS
jgi:hypothetical protein